MSESSLSRYAGQIALATGAGFALVDLARLACQRSGDLLAMMADPSFRLANGAYFVAFVGLAVGLIALHERLAPRIGRFGLAAFLVALAGTMTQGGNMWFDGFAGPWLAEVAPQAIDSEKTITLVVGALAAYVLFALGWMLFGIALLRARVVPVLIPLAVIVAGALGFRSGLPPFRRAHRRRRRSRGCAPDPRRSSGSRWVDRAALSHSNVGHRQLGDARRAEDPDPQPSTRPSVPVPQPAPTS